MSEDLKLVSSAKCFNGYQKVYQHHSEQLKCDSKFAIYFPSTYETTKLPVLIWLSGLTCTEQNFITKSGFQQFAEKYQIVVVAPDTSPRGLSIEGWNTSWDFGEGAGFYVDATEPKWAEHFHMYSYVNDELHQLLAKSFNVDMSRVSIFGHSMGGHGALISFLKNPNKYRSCSAFAPIANPSNCNWGIKAFTNYIGADNENWKKYDATELALVYTGPQCDILVDQGSEDGFLKDKQLMPEILQNAAKTNGKINLHLNFREGYDHSYYFISTFMEEHFKHHAKHLN